jgi:hypothetical protein
MGRQKCPDCGADQTLFAGGVGCKNGHGYGEWGDGTPLSKEDHRAMAEMHKREPTRINIKQDFADNDPDRVAVVFQRDLIDVQHGGGEVTATWGREVYKLADYTSCEVGPFSVTVSLRPGETHEAALDRAMGICETFAMKSRTKKLADYKAQMVALRGKK